MAVGGVALFGADTVYGLACDPHTDAAVRRLYAIKGRRPDKPAAVPLFSLELAPAAPPPRRLAAIKGGGPDKPGAVLLFSLELALAALPELGPRTVAALEGLLPG